MNYILGFLPGEQAKSQVGKIVRELGSIFDGQDIDVRWVRPDTYHVTLLYLGNSLNYLQKAILKWKLNRIEFPMFEMTFEKSNVGFSRSYKELVYLSLSKGGDEVRDMLYKLRSIVHTNDSEKFIPHLTLGRISKDLSNEEYKNLVLDVRNMNKDLEVDKISFLVTELFLMKFDQGKIEIIERFGLK